MSIDQGLHLQDDGPISDERLSKAWELAYEAYSERWSDDDVQLMLDVGEDICAALEELYELRRRGK